MAHHGRTNATTFEDERVVKRYLGADASERMRNEVEALRRTRDRVPAPAVLDVDEACCTVTLARLPGRHGQELIVDGFADAVLESAGRTLRVLHAARSGWTHGDYGPQNLLFDDVTFAVTGVLDWEFARPGPPIADLAWAEWIVRMHHPSAASSLASLFRGWGDEPPWDVRQAEMVDRCRAFGARAATMADTRGEALWAGRADLAAAWTE